MRYCAAVTLAVFGLGLPACAQRGAAHGSFASHAGATPSSFAQHSTFTPHFSGSAPGYRSAAAGHPSYLQRSASSRPGSFAPYHSGLPFTQRPAFYTRSRSSFGQPGSTPYPDAGHNEHLHHHHSDGYGLPFPILVISPYASGNAFADSYAEGYQDTFLDPFADYAADASQADPNRIDPQSSAYAQQPVPPYADPGQSNQAPQPSASDPRGYGDLLPSAGQVSPPRPPFADDASASPASSAEPDTVTILFKDGRPPLQVRNYALTRTALYITGQHFYEIPLTDIDLPAMQRVNWNAGIVFRLPDAK